MDTRSLGARSFVTKRSLLILFAAVLLLAFVASEQALAHSRGNHQRGDVARYILPPGNYGGIPFTQNSTDQLPLYSGLTPLRDNITNGDIDHFFLPENFQPIEPAHEEQTGRPGLRLIYDSYGRPAPTSPSAPGGSRRGTAGSCSSWAGDRHGPPWPTFRTWTPSPW